MADVRLMSSVVLMWRSLVAREDVDCLPMAKPDAFNHLEIRRDCGRLSGVSGRW